MEITTEITRAFAADPEMIQIVKLTYRNGGVVNGTIRKLKISPLKMVLQKTDPGSGERALHRAIFEHVSALEVHYTDGSVLKFP